MDVNLEKRPLTTGPMMGSKPLKDDPSADWIPLTHEYSLTELAALVNGEKSERQALLQIFGGTTKLCERLGTDPVQGLPAAESVLRKQVEKYGANYVPPKPGKTFVKFMLEAMNDTTLIILTVAAIVSIGLSFYRGPEDKHAVEDPGKDLQWIDGAVILLAVMVIVLATAFNNQSKDRQFLELEKAVKRQQTFSVTRDGQVVTIPVAEIVVGDVCNIKYGDEVPADGIIICSNDLRIDESALTGESDYVKKGLDTDPVLLSGTHVMEGLGTMVVVAVGVHTQTGIIMKLLINSDKDEDEAETVLRSKLTKLAVQIGFIGTVIAVLTLLVLATRFSIETFVVHQKPWRSRYASNYVEFFIISIIVLVIAVPEGLPLATMLSLAYSVKKMMSDNNLVRHLDACETMGNATTICTDKTGTLTTNRMTVIQCYVEDNLKTDMTSLTSGITMETRQNLANSVAINTSHSSSVQRADALWSYIGNKTERALLVFVEHLGFDYKELRLATLREMIRRVYTFSSERKSMTTVVAVKSGRYRVFTKGAAELILAKCSSIIGKNGKIRKLTASDIEDLITNVINPMASDGLRTLCIAYRDLVQQGDIILPHETSYVSEPDWENEESIVSNLTCMCIVGIQDLVRPEVPLAISRCQNSGVTVRMVTGDNVKTAKAIAIKCGILTPGTDSFAVMDGPEFNRRIRSMPNAPIEQELVDRVWPKLRVLARATPQDKYNLVRGIMDSTLNDSRQIVAVTGDGTNDGPALKKADVGFAMGRAGTDVAKAASDIIVLDDNFSSIVKALMWGRHVYDSIAKFLQFQLTVNVVAVALEFFAACTIRETPLKPIQMIWTNLVQDTLASLSLATEPPSEELLKRKPYDREEHVVSPIILINIAVHSVYQLVVVLAFLFLGDQFLDVDSGRASDKALGPTQHMTFVFNVFVMMTMFNQINCRKIDGSRNVFSRLHLSTMFIIIWTLTVIAQILMVQFGSFVFYTAALTADQWMWCLFFGVGELIIGQVVCCFTLMPCAQNARFRTSISRADTGTENETFENDEHRNILHKRTLEPRAYDSISNR